MKKTWEQVEADLDETRAFLDEVELSMQHLEEDMSQQKSSAASSQSSLLENDNSGRRRHSATGRLKKATKFLSILTGKRKKNRPSNGTLTLSDVESNPPSQNTSDLESGGEEDKLIRTGNLIDVDFTTDFPPDYITTPSKRQMNKSQVHSETYNESLKPQDYQVCVTIIEARQLSGLNMDPVVSVQYFVFEFHMPSAMLFDQIITLTVYHSRKLLRKSAIVGSFKLDVGTVYAQPDHQFYQKWAVLTDPTDVLSGAKGYLRCNISVCSKGDTLTVPPQLEKDDDDIEANLLLPEGIRTQRQQARYVLRIHRADGLPSLNTGVVASVKRAFSGDSLGSFLDPFVQVFFAGHMGRTSVQKGTSSPVWNEQITFIEMFPPLVRRIKIQVRDSDSVNSSLIATHYLDFATISDEGRRGFLPTFGPCFIHLYGSTGESTVLSDRNAALSEGIGEGVAYKGRLLISLKVDVLNEYSSSIPPGVCVELCPSASEGVLGLEEEFLLFACILDVSMLDKRLVDKPVSLQLSIGNSGTGLETNVETEGSEHDWHSLRGRSMQNRSATASVKAITNDSNYAYLPSGDEKQCLYIWSKWPDQRRRLWNSNVLRKMSDSLRFNLQELESSLEMNDKDVETKFQTTIDNFSQSCCRYLMTIRNMTGERSCMNKLDKERYRTCQHEIDRLSNHARNLRSAVNRRPMSEKICQAYSYVESLKNLAVEPQDSLPDAFLWLLQGNKRVAYHRFSAQDLLYSTNDDSRGSCCGVVHSFYLKVPGRQSHSEELWRIHGHVTGYLWLGSSKEKKIILDGLPKGYSSNADIKEIDRPNRPPPRCLEFKEKNNFELRCHLFQARSLIGSDSTGLSDPFARIVFAGFSATTQVIDETLNPTWDELLVVPSATLYGAAADIASNPPSIVVEIFDQDKMGKKEFIGQAVAQPVVKLTTEKYAKPKFPPSLSWVQIFRGAERAGEILCAFELLQIAPLGADHFEPYPPVTQGRLTESSLFVVPVPDAIRPSLSKFRIEVLFWGLRDLKRVNLVSIDKPRIDVECGGYVVSSVTTSKNPNFSNLTKHLDIDLPENPIFWPPLIIRCVDFRHFGRFVLIGTNTINSIDRFMHKKSSTEFLPLTDSNRQQSIIVDVDGEPALLLADSRYTSDIQINRKKIQPPLSPTKKDQEKQTQEELDSLDWWSKYFASVEEMHKENRKTKSALAQTLESVEDAAFHKNVYACGGEKKKKRNGTEKKSTTKKKSQCKGSDDVAKLKIYQTELEAVDEFHGFNDWLDSFDLYRGKKSFNVDNSRCVGRFKGAIRICQHPLPSEAKTSFFKQMPSNDPTTVLVRVYIVKANDLHPADINGKADPYCVITLGKTKINDKENYISKQLNPIFGKCFEIEAVFPLESQLCVQVYDWDLIGMDDLIGETWVDLENRFYSRHRATCGMALQYDATGYNMWRDPFKPTQILSKLCKENKLEGPFYMPGQVRVGSTSFHVPVKNEERLSGTKVNSELLALYALHHWSEVPKAGCILLPEHVEQRPLYHPDKPGIVQGSLEMWVDMFPMDMPMPGPPVDIAPRKPKSYELRIIIWNTEDVLLEDDAFFTGEKMSDIYVKGWLKGPQDAQCTDIHYRSLTGEGNFNWRFVFPFDYLTAEEKIVISRRETMFSWDETESKIPPRLELQVWDADHFSADDFLGSLTLDLTNFPRGAKSSKLCTLAMLNPEADVPMINIFKQKRIKGWWPFQAKNEHGEVELTGKVEAEIHLLMKEEAETNPAGLGRSEPDALEKPSRPDSSFVWFLNPLKSMRYILWHNYKWMIVKLLVVLFVVLLLIIFIYSIPGYMAKRMVDA